MYVDLRSWLYVDLLSRPVVVVDGLPGLYGLKYDSATACGLPSYLCSYKLDGSATRDLPHTYSCTCLIEYQNKNKQGLYQFEILGA